MLPWINTTAVDQRRALIAAWIASDAPVAELARRFRVSRKTAHKFINRFNQLGDAGLHDFPRATDPNLAAMIVDAKRNAPLLGPKKIIPTLRDAHPDLPWPAPSTAGAILDRAGARQAPQALPPLPSLRRPLRRRPSPQRLLGHRLQGLGADKRRNPPRPPYAHRRRLPLPHRLRGAPAPNARRVLPVRVIRPRRPLRIRRPPRQTRHNPRTHRARPSRAERAPRTLPSDAQGGRDEPARRNPRRPAARLRRPSAASTTRSAPIRRWASARRPPATPRRRAPTPTKSQAPNTAMASKCAGCGATERSSGRGSACSSARRWLANLSG